MLLHGQLLLDPARPPATGWLRTEGDRIAEIGQGTPPERPDAGHERALICPGFVDAHLHLPQLDAMGYDGRDLLTWLETVIFPVEARWADEPAAEEQVERAYRRMLAAGTLTYAGYLTSHLTGMVVTIRAAHRLPLRGLAGQSLMDRSAPPALLDQAIGKLARSARGRFAATVNPRFAVCCSDRLLARAGRMGRRAPLVQTHLAETVDECALVRRLFPDDPHYAGVYDRHGLLTPRTLLAHCLHLDDAQWQLIARRQSVVVHCPTANTFLRAGLFDFDAAADHGVRLALGSDVAAGPDLAMPRVARAMIEVAKLRALTIAPRGRIPNPAEAWAMITRGNAEALGLDDAGRLEPGAAADLLVLEVPFEPDADLVGRLIYTWRDDYIAHRIVAGQLMPAGSGRSSA